MNSPWHLVQPLSNAAFADFRQRAIFDCFKFDVQTGDVSTLSPRPIVLTRETWAELSQLAEALALETAAAQSELTRHPELHSKLGLPRKILKHLALASDRNHPAIPLQAIRFDFHYTTQGWQISEANADVPGGYTEASCLTELILDFCKGLAATGNPAQTLAQTINEKINHPGTVALVHATAFTDDRQAMLCLARNLQRLGLRAELVSPEHLNWERGRAFIRADWHSGPASFVFRFFPAEWLVNLKTGTGWSHFFHGAITPFGNPGTALLIQSKRFPLVWDDLKTPLPTWRRLMPETRALDQVNWKTDPAWVLKPALGRVGEMIGLRGVVSMTKWDAIYNSVLRHPEHWVAQRRFEAVPMGTESGHLYPCIGIYTINGRIAGAYGRLAPVPLINQFAQEAAVLIEAAPPEKIQSRSDYGQNRSI